MGIKLTQEDIRIIENALSERGKIREIIIRPENGKAVLIQVEKKKIN